MLLLYALLNVLYSDSQNWSGISKLQKKLFRNLLIKKYIFHVHFSDYI